MKFVDSDIQVISFDIGNTLIDLNEALGFCTYFCRKTGLNVDSIRGVLNDFFLKSNADVIDSVRKACKILGIDEYASIISGYQKTKAELFSDVLPILHRLKQEGYQLIACSNCVKWDADDPNGLLHANLDKIFYSFEIGYAKPEIGFFKFVSNSIGVDGKRILHIGDSLKVDYYAAIDAGWKALLLDRKNTKVGTSVNRIKSLLELE